MVKETQKKICVRCQRSKSVTRDFFVSNSSIFPDGRVNTCKACLKTELDENDIASVRRVLRQIDRPFIKEKWFECVQAGKETLGWYLREVSTLPQYKDKTYDDSDGMNEVPEATATMQDNFSAEKRESKKQLPDVPLEIKLKFGEGFTDFEYLQMEQEYDAMKTSNPIETPQHVRQLIQYCQNIVLMDRARRENRMKDYKDLNAVQKDLVGMAGFAGKDKRDGAQLSGVRSFSQIFAEVEKRGYIKPAPIEENQDIVDRTIQYMLNYNLRLFDRQILDEPPHDTPKVSDVE